MVWRATATEAKATDGDSRRGRSIRAFANGVPIGLLGYFADEPVAGCSIAPRATSVSMNLTLQYDQVLFILEPTGIARSLARKRVTVIDYPDGRLAIRHNGVDLPYRTFDKRPQVIR
jgi:hypothetical protein